MQLNALAVDVYIRKLTLAMNGGQDALKHNVFHDGAEIYDFDILEMLAEFIQLIFI